MTVTYGDREYRLVMFDLDDTLAPSKSPLDDQMVTVLRTLLGEALVCIISGGRYEQFRMQVLDRIGDIAELDNLHLMPTCGTQYVRRNGTEWETVYAEDLTDDEKQRTLAALETGAKELGVWETETWGPILEDRGSQITFSALGQSAPVDAKKAWDPMVPRRPRCAPTPPNGCPTSRSAAVARRRSTSPGRASTRPMAHRNSWRSSAWAATTSCSTATASTRAATTAPSSTSASPRSPWTAGRTPTLASSNSSDADAPRHPQRENRTAAQVSTHRCRVGCGRPTRPSASDTGRGSRLADLRSAIRIGVQTLDLGRQRDQQGLTAGRPDELCALR